ncbi:MAG: 50S ribosomal protein L24 [Oscillospiraceae bacterium]|jgi:large subunit ribosomal protein L24|nr:50S ribosomal protein L24 [Oscillospiraceae bacterium]
MPKLNVRKDDTVVLLTGKQEYKYTPTGKRREGKVLEVSPKEGKVIVEGFNLVTKHLKPGRAGQSGSIVTVESPIYACKVQVVCPHCGKPTRIAHTFTQDGDKTIKVRTCKKCSKTF